MHTFYLFIVYMFLLNLQLKLKFLYKLKLFMKQVTFYLRACSVHTKKEKNMHLSMAVTHVTYEAIIEIF